MQNDKLNKLVESFKTGKVSIKVNSQEERNTVENFFKLFGINANGYEFDSNFPYLYYSNAWEYIEATSDLEANNININYNSFNDFLIDKKAEPEFIEVKLNNNHIAKVYKDKVVVGCQTFPINIIDKLNTAKESLNKG